MKPLRKIFRSGFCHSSTQRVIARPKQKGLDQQMRRSTFDEVHDHFSEMAHALTERGIVPGSAGSSTKSRRVRAVRRLNATRARLDAVGSARTRPWAPAWAKSIHNRALEIQGRCGEIPDHPAHRPFRAERPPTTLRATAGNVREGIGAQPPAGA